jgi:hypothetical protein
MSEHSAGPCYCQILGDEWGHEYIEYCSLHAAAPELLAALEGALELLVTCEEDETLHTVRTARAAIAKARGEQQP